MKKLLTIALSIALCLAFTIPALASDDDWGRADKFKRGMKNVLTSPLEIPAQMKVEYERQKESTNPTLAGKGISVVGGLLKGVGMFGVRLVAGVYEAATFNVDIGNDEPVLKPESVTEHFNK